MQSYARSLTLTAALLFASLIALLIVAAPQTTKTGGGTTRPGELAPGTTKRSVVSEPPVAPITFADPDGQELVLEELNVRAAIHGMLSLTEMELRFRNPQQRRIEGRFTCTLPPNAAISRFAKEVNGQLMEGEVVERLRANQVYESFLHQMRDPALLEQDQGNRFSARIFPIEAGAQVRLIVSWTALLPLRDGQRTYALPLRGLSKVNKLTFRAFASALPGEAQPGRLTTSSADVTSFEERDWTPDRDILLTWKGSEERTRVLRAGDFYLAAIRPDVQPRPRTASSGKWLFYVDTSASSAEGAPHRIRAIEELLAALPPNDRVQLLAFDQDVVPLANGRAADIARTAGDLLRNRLFLGGTDLGLLLRDVTRALRDDPSRTVVLASDLVPTLGDVSSHDLQASIGALPPRSTIHALILGSREDAATAKAITAGRGRVVRVPFTEALDARARDAAEELRRPLGGSFDLADAGAEWVYPSHFDDVQPGDEVIALGRIKAGQESRLAAGEVASLDSSTFGPLLEREAYRAYLDYLSQREANEPSEAVRRALAAEQVKISTEQRVVTPRTTLLVLETEWDYQRFGLDRRALAAILTIDAGGIGRIDRRGSPPPVLQVTSPVDARRERALSAPKATAAPGVVPPRGGSLAAQQARDFVEEEGPGTSAIESVANGVAADVEGGVVGGVVGGVAGGTAGGVMAGVPPPPPPAEMSRRVTADAPAPEEAPVMHPNPASVSEPRRVQEAPRQIAAKRAAPNWTSPRRPSQDDVDELEASLRRDPRDREMYNQLGEALAARGEWNALRALALRWQPYDPENPQVYELLGTASDAMGKESEAARAFASLIEIAPAKPELLQRAGLLLLRTNRGALAEAPLRRALELRPDRANAYRHLALLLWQDGRIEEAVRVLESAVRQDFPRWYGDVHRVLREELAYAYRAWMKKDSSRRDEIERRAREAGVNLEGTDALRVTLAWETDANDVDLHVVDPSGEEVDYTHRESRSGLQLYEDITQGLGPEVIRTSRVQHGVYHVGVKYFAAGPMGISRGVVLVMRDGDLSIHPFRLAKGGEDIRYVTGVKVQ